jgi:hypothetical protein
VKPVPSRDELLADWLAENARQANPLPVCVRCGFPFQRADGGFLSAEQCGSCETGQIEALVRDLVDAVDRPSTLRALHAIARLAI